MHYFGTMMSLEHTDTNRRHLAAIERRWREQLVAALVRGFHGSISIQLSVQDGTIQHARHTLERMEKDATK